MISPDQHLDGALSHLQQISAADVPYVGLHKAADTNSNACIGANKEGLILLATQLLQIAAESNVKNIDAHHAIATRLGWINHYSDIPLDRIIVRDPPDKEIAVVGGSLKDKIGNIGIVSVLLLILLLALFGLYLIGYFVWGFLTGGGF